MTSTMGGEDETLSRFSYLTIVPRGLQNEISSSLQEQAKSIVAVAAAADATVAASRRNNDNEFCDMNKIYCHQDGSIKNASGTTTENDILKVSIWNELEDNETMQEALRDFSLQQEEKQKRQLNTLHRKVDVDNRNNSSLRSQQRQPKNKNQLEQHTLTILVVCYHTSTPYHLLPTSFEGSNLI